MDMKTNARSFSGPAALICAVVFLLFSIPGLAQQPRQVLHSHVRPAVSSGQAALAGSLPAAQRLNFSIVLPLRNQAGLASLLGQIYNPASPNYHHFLGVAQFTEQFGPTAEDYQAVVNFARSNGFTVTDTPANRLLVALNGSVDQIEKAFQVSMKFYQHPTENRTFFSPDREPSLNLHVPVSHIAGLNNLSIPRPLVKTAHAERDLANAAVSGSGPSGSYLGSDMRAAYYGGTALTGSGQTVGLVEFDGYNLSDVNLTFSKAGQSYNVPINNVLLDGATGASASGEDAEEVLDIAQAIGMAPGLSQVRVYIGNNDADILNAMATENLAQQLSISWTWNPDDPATDDIFFEEFAAQGQSIFAASGDYGAFDPFVDFVYPAEDAYVTAVGGTDLVTNGAGGAWSSETAWSYSGGGISLDGIPIPSWQTGVANSSNGGSTALRNVPDVAMEANTDNYYCNMGTCSGGAGGTSFAAPRWAAFIALANQQAVAAGNQTVGFINPAIYQIGESSAYTSDFHDITSGSSFGSVGIPSLYAVPGYDLVTGWGSPAGQNLINALALPAAASLQLSASPNSLTINPGNSATTTITATEQAGFSGSVSLAVTSALPSGVTASFGTNPTNGSSVLTLTVDSSAIRGSYLVTVTGTSGTQSATTNIALLVNAPGFTIAPSPGELAIPPGTSLQTTITVTNYAGFTGAVNFALTSPLPSGVTTIWNSGSTPGTSALMFTASNSAVSNTHAMLTITGTSGTLTATCTVALTITGPQFLLDVSPLPFNLFRGSTVTPTVTLVPIGNFTGTVNLSIVSLPSGVMATFNPTSITNSGSSVLTLTTSSTAPVGKSWVVLEGTGPHGTSTDDIQVAVLATAPGFSMGILPAFLTLTQGGSATETVAINPQNGFNGSVTLSIPPVYLPSGVTASFSPNPTTGTSVLTLSASSTAAVGFDYFVEILGTSGSLSSAAEFALQVNPAPGFALAVSPASVAVTQGSSGSSTITVAGQPGFIGNVNLAAFGLPSGVTASFTPNPTNGTSVLTLTASSSAAIGTFPVTVTGSSGTLVATTGINLTINSSMFTLSASPASLTVTQGAAGSSTITVTDQPGFTGNVTLAASGLPDGVSALFSPNPATGTSVLTLTVSGSATAGSYSLTLTGTSGSLTATTGLSLTVGAADTVPVVSVTGEDDSAYAIKGQGAGWSLGQASKVYISAHLLNGGGPGYVSQATAYLMRAIGPGTTTAQEVTHVDFTLPAQYNGMFPLFSGVSLAAGNYWLVFSTPATPFSYVSWMWTWGNRVSIATANGAAYVGDVSVSGPLAAYPPASTFNPVSPTTYVYQFVVQASTTDFTLGASPASLTVTQGATATDTITVNAENGFTGSVNLTATGLPTGVTANFETNPATGSSTLTLTASNTAALGTATVTITGTSGSLTATTTVTLTVNSSVSVALASSLNPSTYGQSVTFSATVSPSSATGTVQFMDGSTSLGTVTISGGMAALPVSTLAVGTHSITAVYSGDANEAGGTSAILTQTVNTAASIVTLGSSANPSTSGQNVTFTATISPSLATGTVQFLDGTIALGTVTISGGSAALSLSTLAVGSHSITAVYSGDGNDATSTSAVLVQVVTITTTTTLTSSLNPSTYFTTVTLTASITPATATGVVQFFNGATLLGTAALANGQAQLAVTTLPVGTNQLTAAYLGDSLNAASTSAALSQVVTKMATTTALVSFPNPSTVGATVTLTASVTPGNATGTVQFFNGAVLLGTAALTNGQVQLAVSNLPAGTNQITATYGGDSLDTGSTSAILTQTVNKVNSSVALASSLNPSTNRQSVTFTATVSPSSATGTVQFLDGANALGTATISGGSAALSLSTLAVGAHSITAVYSGDTNDATSTSAVLTQTVNKVNSSVALASSLNPSTNGQSVTFTATVSPSSATGTVQFLDGSTALGTVTISGGSAALSLSTLAAGAHSITAVYSGDGNDAASTSAVLTQTVNKTASSVALASSLNPSPYGQSVTFKATVSPSSATGTVQFLDGSTALGTVTVSGGSAALSLSTLAAGSHSITAVYSGDANNATSTSAVLTQTVNKTASSVALASSLNPSTYGQNVTFKATVSPSSATGTVQFRDGSTALGTVTISGGSAALSLSTLAAGAHSITAVYSGDGNNATSTSAVLTQTVNKTASSVALASSLNPFPYGQSVTFKATVSPSSATGTVQFRDGSTALGTVTVSGGSAALSLSTLAVGAHSITAVYSGDSNDTTSTSAVLTQTVNKANSSVALASSLNPSTSGQSVTFTATVSPSSATGTVKFLNGSTTLGTVTISGGSAALSLSTLAVGAHSITAVYSGDGNDTTSTSAILTQTVSAALPGSPASLTAMAVSSSQINLSWSASSTHGVTYNIYSAATSGFTPSASNRIASGVTATSYSNTGLAASTTRYYVVTAQSSSGESAPSNQATATTGASGAACHVTYTVTTHTSTTFSAAITIKNTGTKAINGWNLAWTWAGNQQITQSSDSTYSQSGTVAKLTNISSDAAIAAGATISGIGFNASYSGTNTAPSAFYLNGTLCK